MRPLKFVLYISVGAFLTFLFNEFFLYYLVLYQVSFDCCIEDDAKSDSVNYLLPGRSSQCEWPGQLQAPVRAMLIADTHLLGPYRGHWFDRLRREWQMHRTFQTAMSLFQPHIVFILGDVFDEGDIVNQKEYRRYVMRFQRLFKPPPGVEMYSIIGNHDAGFHYR